MISYKEAQNIVWEAAQAVSLKTEYVPLAEIGGRICAEEIQAPISIQPFDNSAMDGFAVRRVDIAQATEATPVMLPKYGVIAAGGVPLAQEVPVGQCVHIMTGAVVPSGVDAVVPIENVKVEGENIRFTAVPKENANIRFAGEDFTKGDVLVKPGDRLRTAHILPFATLGVDKVKVYRKPRSVFISTGLELVDDLTAPLKDGEIYNSNRPYARAMLEAMGTEVIVCETIHDNSEVFEQVLKNALENNVELMVSSGAVSAGEFDFVKECLERSGAEILYHRIKLKPGKPNLLARFPNGTLYFGLPGNPVATAVGLRFFVNAALRAMTHQGKEVPQKAVVTRGFTKKPHLQMFLKGHVGASVEGVQQVSVPDGQASFMVSPFLKMNAWVSVPEGVDCLQVGDVVDIYTDVCGS